MNTCTFQADLNKYSPFINSIDTDPISELESYVKDADYDSCIGDLIIPILVQIIKTTVVVLEFNTETKTYNTSNNLNYQYDSDTQAESKVYLLKNGKNAEKRDEHPSAVASWVRTKTSFALLRSALMCVRGTRHRYYRYKLEEVDIEGESQESSFRSM